MGNQISLFFFRLRMETKVTRYVCAHCPLFPCFAAALPCYGIAAGGYLVAKARARAPSIVRLVLSVPLCRALYMLGCRTFARVSRPSVSSPKGLVVYRTRINDSRQGVAPSASPCTHAPIGALPLVGR